MLSYAATWQNFEVLKDNSYHSVLEHFDNLQDYIDTPYQVGKTVGRVAGRITGARFSIAKKEYQLRPNEGSNLLHSGKHGIQDYNFDAECFEDENKISFTQKISETKDGFPGDLDLKITYRLDDDDQVSITYTATSDKNTLFNPTCHAYFNVSNNDTIFDQKLQINSDKMLQVDDEKLPTGKILTADKAYDFKNPKTISTALKELKKNNGKLEFDDTYITESDLVATISSKNAAIDFYSDRNGLVIFTANPIDQTFGTSQTV
jgi:Galactose mutarotase and related enzymes